MYHGLVDPIRGKFVVNEKANQRSSLWIGIFIFVPAPCYVMSRAGKCHWGPSLFPVGFMSLLSTLLSIPGGASAAWEAMEMPENPDKMKIWVAASRQLLGFQLI